METLRLLARLFTGDRVHCAHCGAILTSDNATFVEGSYDRVTLKLLCVACGREGISYVDVVQVPALEAFDIAGAFRGSRCPRCADLTSVQVSIGWQDTEVACAQLLCVRCHLAYVGVVTLILATEPITTNLAIALQEQVRSATHLDAVLTLRA